MFPPSTRSLALSQWQSYLPAAGAYAERRNHVTPGHPAVSRLSPALRTRLVLEEEIVGSLLARYPFPRVEKLAQEILWRTYWKGWLEQRPSVWTHYQAWLRTNRPALPSALQTRIAAVESGQSGVAFMDALTRELKTTGYLHNHARMWFAAFWVHTRQLPWQAGADFFYRHLLDADAASNTLSWRWVAGLQTAGKTYLVRRSNLEKYAAAALSANPEGLEELADSRATAAPIPPDPNPPPRPLPPAPAASLPSGPHALWLHWDDLRVDGPAIAPALAPSAILAIWPTTLVADWSPVKINHFRAALRDGLDRAAAAYQCPGVWLEADNPAVAIASWLRENPHHHLVAQRPLVGDWSDVPPALATAGVPTTWLERAWDRRFFPMATKGFFGFWEAARPAVEGMAARS